MEEEVEKRGITMNQLIKESINSIFKQDMRAIEIRINEEQKLHNMLQEQLKKSEKKLADYKKEYEILKIKIIE